ncbi:type I-E CRISPR-associated protein Cas6/Cse3/CasE [Roseibacillus persicicus]|uniref:type I-E CRISPR-associated protein Cas6/Cse3/CasE n=1 Tax=Roseibacillus persicicus TaxID=454148 RepID=UPI00398B7026
MILTQAHIPYDIAARAWKANGFRDSYAWHQRIWEAFPNQPKANRNFLTRLDDTGQDFRLLILSPDPPTRPDWCPSTQWESKAMDANFFHHPAYHFSLVANPTVKLVIHDEHGQRKKNGKRVPLIHREDKVIDGRTIPGLETWMQRKAAQHGFAIHPDHPLRIDPRPEQTFIKQGTVGKHQATEFSGVLTVSDQALFEQAVTQGIGSAKAFGFGLLCLSPINL